MEERRLHAMATITSSISQYIDRHTLELYYRLPTNKINDYEGLKEAPLRRFQLTEEGFRQGLVIRESIPSAQDCRDKELLLQN